MSENAEDEDSDRDGRTNNKRDNEEQDLASKRLTYDDSYFNDNPLERIQIQSHSSTNSEGALFSSMSSGEEITFSYGLRNYQQQTQQYCFILEIIDENGLTLSIQYAKGDLDKGEKVELEKR